MGRKRGGKPDWGEAKRLCRLSEDEIRMAKELGFAPRSLIKNRPTPAQQWKAPVKWWIRERYAKRFPDRIGDPVWFLEGIEEPGPPASKPPVAAPAKQPSVPRTPPERDADAAAAAPAPSAPRLPDPEPDSGGGDWAAYSEQEALLAPLDEALRAEVLQEWRYPLLRYHEFRQTAEAVAAAWSSLEAVERIVLFGSVAQPLPMIKPRSRRLRRARVMTWHDCGDIDLAVWLHDLSQLRTLQKRRSRVLNELSAEHDIGVAHHQLDAFIMEPGSDRYLGRLCSYRRCPKGKPECRVSGCGEVPLLRVIEGFSLAPQALSPGRSVVLWERGTERTDLSEIDPLD
jgi:hypothetical protein